MFRIAFSKTNDRSVDAVLAPVRLSSRSSEELVEMQYQDIFQEFLNVFQLGLTGEVVAFQHLWKGNIEYTIRLSNQTKDLTFRSVAMVKDGKIVLVWKDKRHIIQIKHWLAGGKISPFQSKKPQSRDLLSGRSSLIIAKEELLFRWQL
jgi:hypothetical protein